MSTFLAELLLFAEEGGGDGGGGGGSPFGSLLLPFLAIGFLFYLLLLRPQQKQRSRQDAMLRAIKTGDHIVTIGGINGVVTNVHEDKVTVRVDESNNTKLSMTLSAIARVIVDEASDDKSQ